MASITTAKQRLEKAVTRLESAVQTVSAKDANDAEGARVETLESERAKLDTQLSALRVEHETLEQQYSTARGDYVALEKVIDKVSDRLDATIGRLCKVLES